MASRNVNIDDFVPYRPDDIGIIIPHASMYPQRWKWFWPNFMLSTPEVVLRNSVVVYHLNRELDHEVPSEVRAVEDAGVKLAVVRRTGRAITWSTMKGLELCRSRLIARIGNDVLPTHPGWIGKILDQYNKEPHLKILSTVVAPGPPYENLRKICYEPWMKRLLKDGEYDYMSFLLGAFIVMNRALWMGYYPLVAEYTIFEREDIYLSLFSRADGVPLIRFGEHFKHCGSRFHDEINDPKKNRA